MAAGPSNVKILNMYNYLQNMMPSGNRGRKSSDFTSIYFYCLEYECLWLWVEPSGKSSTGPNSDNCSMNCTVYSNQVNSCAGKLSTVNSMKYLAVICRTLIWSKAPQKTLQKHYFALAGIELSRLDSRVLVQSLSNKRTFGRKKPRHNSLLCMPTGTHLLRQMLLASIIVWCNTCYSRWFLDAP